VLEENVYDLI